MLNDAVLLLNSTYEPLNVINVKRALRLLLTHKADPVEAAVHTVHSVSRSVPMPVVVRLQYYVKRPNQRVKFTKRTVLARDQHACQYCGVQARDLTLDHVVPKTLGGPTVWTNVVAACKKCNGAKGGRLLKDAGLKLVRAPREPRFLPYLRLVKNAYQKSWDKYLFMDPESPYLLRGPLPVAGSQRAARPGQKKLRETGTPAPRKARDGEAPAPRKARDGEAPVLVPA